MVGIQRTDFNISGLVTDTTYTIWIMSLTAEGFGVSSKAVNITTPRQGIFTHYDTLSLHLFADFVWLRDHYVI